MAAYVTKDDMLGVMPEDLLTTALDDASYGTEGSGVWDSVVAGAGRRIDGILGVRYEVPFSSPIPAVVKQAAIVYTAHLLYLRRQHADNPWKDEAERVTEQLEKIAAGEHDLMANDTTREGAASPTVITEDSRTHSERLLI
jgi:phage gp36-like protein